jgi:hypothetical protein
MRRSLLSVFVLSAFVWSGATSSRAADPAKPSAGAKPAAKQPAKKPAGPLPTDAAQKEAPQLPPKEGKRETLYLFNGKDLTGWVGHKGKYWNIDGDTIVGKNTDEVPVSTYLLTERKFSDFRLTFDFKLARIGDALGHRDVGPGRAGARRRVHVRRAPRDVPLRLRLLRPVRPQRRFTATAPRLGPLNKQHDWNRMEILAQGNRIRFVLNGTLVSDWREPEPDRIKEAPIGLQLHSNKVPQEVRFKNLVLDTFPDDKLTTT